MAICVFATLPDTIPTHSSLGGEPDAWADKWSAFGIMTFFLPPLASLIVCLSLYYGGPGMLRFVEETKPSKHGYDHIYIEMSVPMVAVIMLIAQIFLISTLYTNV